MNDCPLTDHELSIVARTANGEPAKVVARAVGISVNTVQSYVRMIKLKIQAKNVSHMVAICLRRGWIS